MPLKMAKRPATAHHHYSPMQSLSSLQPNAKPTIIIAQCKAPSLTAQCTAFHQCKPTLSGLPTACPSKGPTFPPSQRTIYQHCLHILLVRPQGLILPISLTTPSVNVGCTSLGLPRLFGASVFLPMLYRRAVITVCYEDCFALPTPANISSLPHINHHT